jgi:hypothetical protein
MTKISMSSQNAKNSIEDMNNAANIADDAMTEGYRQLGEGITQAGMAAAGLGVAFGMLGTAAESAGLDDTADILNGIGKVATIAGTALMMLGPVFKLVKIESGKATISIMGTNVALVTLMW